VRSGFLTIYWRDMIRFTRFKSLLVASLLQPALWLAFFGIAMSSNFDRFASGLPSPAGVMQVSYLTFMCAGVIAMTTLFTSLYGGIVFLFDKNWGMLREVLASPLPRNSIVIGIGFSGVTKASIQAAVITVFGLLLGVQFFSEYSIAEIVIGILGMFAFIAIFSLGFLFLSSAIAITMETPEGLQAVITLLTMPIFFASNALYPTENFPDALKIASSVNPLTYMITGIRYYAIGDSFSVLGIAYTYAPAEIALSFAFLVIFAAITFALAWWRFQVAKAT